MGRFCGGSAVPNAHRPLERSATLFLVKTSSHSFRFVGSSPFAAMPWHPLVPAVRRGPAVCSAGCLSAFLHVCSVPADIRAIPMGVYAAAFMRSVLLNALPGGLVNVVNLLAVMGSAPDGPSHGADFHCVHTAGRHGRIYGAAVLCWPLSDGALPSWPPWAWASSAHASCWGRCSAFFPSFRARVDAAGRIFSAAATPALMCLFVFLVSRVLQAEAAPFPARPAGWSSMPPGCLPPFLKHIFLHFTARSAF